jgi:hypothetical protein
MVNNDDVESKIREWIKGVEAGVRQDILPKIESSVFVIGLLVPEELDLFLLLQVGAAVVLGKPLIIVALKGCWVPPKARQIADAVVEADTPAETEAGLRKAIGRIMQQLGREERPA